MSRGSSGVQQGWGAVEDRVGTTNVTVTASDDNGGQDAAAFNWIVASDTQAPTKPTSRTMRKS